MRKWFWLGVLTVCVSPAFAQGADTLTPQEQAIIEAIKAKNRDEVPAQPMQAPQKDSTPEGEIKLSEQAKQDAWDEHKQENSQTEGQTPEETNEFEPAFPAEEDDDEILPGKASKKCLTVAFIDIDLAFNEHPRTQAVKKQIDVKIKSKQLEVENARDIIAALDAENNLLSRQLAELKPFYERIVVDQPLAPKVPESADTLELNNLLNRLTFSGSEILSTSPLNSPRQLEDITERIAANKKIIADRSFFIDNYKYQTREEILKLEQKEVKEILQDIYTQIKSFAKKRNIGAVVRKDEILYGQQPVNVTKDFISRLKKSKKYRK